MGKEVFLRIDSYLLTSGCKLEIDSNDITLLVGPIFEIMQCIRGKLHSWPMRP